MRAGTGGDSTIQGPELRCHPPEQGVQGRARRTSCPFGCEPPTILSERPCLLSEEHLMAEPPLDPKPGSFLNVASGDPRQVLLLAGKHVAIRDVSLAPFSLSSEWTVTLSFPKDTMGIFSASTSMLTHTLSFSVYGFARGEVEFEDFFSAQSFPKSQCSVPLSLASVKFCPSVF